MRPLILIAAIVLAAPARAQTDAYLIGLTATLDVAKPGDRILFGKWSGSEVTIDGEELLIMKESDILGIIEASHVRKKAA